jgi:PRC-barrel domain
MGWIIDLLADRDGKVVAAVIEFGGFLGIGTRKIAVEWSALRIEADKSPVAILDVTREQLQSSPEYKPDVPAAVFRVNQPASPSVEPPAFCQTNVARASGRTTASLNNARLDREGINITRQ